MEYLEYFQKNFEMIREETISDTQHSGILALNFGVLARLTWLDSEGHEGPSGSKGA